MIKQNIVFIENKAGSLQKVTGLLAEAGIDIYGFACFDAPEFALFRMVTNQADEAGKIPFSSFPSPSVFETSALPPTPSMAPTPPKICKYGIIKFTDANAVLPTKFDTK